MFQLSPLKATAGKNSLGDVMHARAECLLSIEAAWVFCVDWEHLLCGDEAAPQAQVCLGNLERSLDRPRMGKMRNGAERGK